MRVSRIYQLVAIALLIAAAGCGSDNTFTSTKLSVGTNHFSISASPSSQAFTNRTTMTVIVTVTGTPGYTGTIQLNATGSSWPVSFSSPSVAPGSSSVNSTLTINTVESMPPTSPVTITINGTDTVTNESHSVSVTITPPIAV